MLPGLDVSASYLVGGAEQAAGGDWFDVLPLPGGSVAAVVGDVVGHGVDASAVMAQLRAVTLERLHAGATPAQVVAALDRFVEIMPAARGATICVLTLDVSSGRLEYCSAGHPPPLVTGRAATSAYLDPSGTGPLGEDGQRHALRGRLEREQVLLLYTDGIIERPGVAVTQGTVELRRIGEAALEDELFPVFSLPAAVDRTTAQVLERLTRQSGAGDDITLLALQRTPTLQDLHLRQSLGMGDFTAIAAVREVLKAWFRPGQVDEDALAELDQIVTELCENAAEHAYGGAAGPVTVRAGLDERGVLTLGVCDQGRWRPRPADENDRGLGLAVVQQLALSVTVNQTRATDRTTADPPAAAVDEGAGRGTEVHVAYQPWKHSRSSADSPQPAAQARIADVALMRLAEQNVLWVSGPIDAGVIAELQAELALCVAPGSAPLVIDLERATMLSSTAITVLRRGLRQAENAGIHTHIRARPGSVAHHVLTLAAIPTNG